jgi:GTPase
MTKEKVLLVFTSFDNKKESIKDRNLARSRLDENVEELKSLTSSAGAEVEDILFTNQDKPHPRYFIGKGKLGEAKSIISSNRIELVIFDDEITATQQRNLQTALDTKVVDRTALILDIFAQRAHSSEGKLQVELAQLNYLLTRLTGKGVDLSRLGGGIGTRGPGETKLEVDRRKIRNRISQLEKKIQKIYIQHNIQSKKREDEDVFKIAIVGYTNSGKTTLLNLLTEASGYVEDRLFSTLDSKTRRLKMLSDYKVLISDTVGFIEKLPHQLIASFKSTLEEVKRSDLLLMVIDISKPGFENNILSVKNVLKEIKADNKPAILVFNKIDRVNKERISSVKVKYRESIFISALKKTGITEFYSKIKELIEKDYINMVVRIPYSDNKIISFIYNNCMVLKRIDSEDCSIFNLQTSSKYYSLLSGYMIKKGRGTKKKKVI